MKIAVIVGSTRPARSGRQIADWYYSQVKDTEDTTVDLIDLADINLPLLDEPVPPSSGQYSKDHTKKWAELIDGYDAYVWVTAEYNHSVPGALKNALDFIFKEWNRKPVAMVSYGSMGGVRAAEHLRQIAGELQMADVRSTVMIRDPWIAFDEAGKLDEKLVTGDPKAQMEELIWWARALKNAREAS